MATQRNTKGAARLNRLIDFNSYPLNVVLRILLKDRTTGENIIWATDNYAHLGNTYHSAATMRFKDLVKLDQNIIQPRVYKAIELQKQRTKVNAEVFTPSWICCLMNNHLDDVWFGRNNVFNKMDGQKWRATNRKIEFPETGSKTWRGYVDSRRIEITCGEAPYLVSRYDTTTGKVLPISHRIGILDRKLRVVNENAETEEEWIKWVLRAYQSTYGYEYQGDSLLIARINLLMTFCDYVQDRWDRDPTEEELKTIAHIISWNIFQMNGLTHRSSYDAAADRKRLQKIINDCDKVIARYESELEEYNEYIFEAASMDGPEIGINGRVAFSIDELVELVKKESLLSLAHMYAECNNLFIIDEDDRDYAAELEELNEDIERKYQEAKLLRSETYDKKCKITDAPYCLIKNWRMRRTEYFRDIAQKSKGKGIMKFDFSIGNPPYQGDNHKQIYTDFYLAAREIADCVELIFPVGWQDPKTANNLGKLNTPEIKEDEQIVFIDNRQNVFVDVQGAEWTNIVLWKRGYDNKLEGKQLIYTNGVNPENKQLIWDRTDIKLLVPDTLLIDIMQKVQSYENNVSIMTIIESQNKYNLDALFAEHPEYKKIIGRDGRDKRCRNDAFDKIDAFTEHPTEPDDIKVFGLKNRQRTIRFIHKRYLDTSPASLKKYRVLLPEAAGVGFGAKLSPSITIEPNEAHTQTFISFCGFDKLNEANNCATYIKTKFARALLGILKITRRNNRDVWKYVPIQDFTASSDIDWTKSIPEIDQQLYKKYGLSQEEIDFIEEKVKEME